MRQVKMAKEKCDVCNKTAIYEAAGGNVMQVMHSADSVGDSDSLDRPYPQNKVFRCEKHRYKPDAQFGRLWRWRKLMV